jgi:putative transposase
MGRPVPGDHPTAGVRVAGVCPVPAVFNTHIRTVICTTNAIEPINARIRRAVNARGHFLRAGRAEISVPGDPIPRPDRGWQGTMDGAVKPALNAFAITFDGRLSTNRK